MAGWARLLTCLALSTLALPAHAATYDEQVAALTHGLPARVQTFIDRRLDCNHWAGEEPYDAARLAEINGAERKLRCAALDRDEAALRKRYRRNPAVLKALTTSRDFLPD